MENNYYAILMFAFAGLLLIYSLILYITKDSTMIMRDWAVKMKDKKLYARQFSKLTALVSLAPILSGITALFSSVGLGLGVLVGAMVILLIIGVKKIKGFF